MRRISIIGAGQAGLILAHKLLRAGYPVAVYSDRSAVDWLERSTPTGTAYIYRENVDIEEGLGLGFWNHLAPKGDGVHLSFCPTVGNELMEIYGRFKKCGYAVDQRLKNSKWLTEFAARGGLEHARPDLFAGRPWLLSTEGDAAGAALDKLTVFVTALGAEPRVIAPAAHDRLLAYLSHLPQLTASALMQIVGGAVGEHGLALAGRGLADTTRLASSPADIWTDIAATNADELGPALDTLIALLQDLRRDLPNGDRLAEVFADANRYRLLLRGGGH